MKKLILLSIMTLVCFALFAENMQIQPLTNQIPQTTRARTGEEVFYLQDFNDGWQGWETIDMTDLPNQWHLTDWNAYGGEGYSWWMGDPEIGGYYNQQYLVLDTPEILVPANGILTFKLTYSIEYPDADLDDYDGWDAANVRISTDGGETWVVLHGLPEYDADSMYSFGFQHGEGPGVPGWGGNSGGWVDAEFDLSDYSGQNVMIRFAFASDPGLDTNDDPELFGVMIDNIALGTFVHDFNDGDTQGMIASSLVETAGDIWHIAERDDAPLPPNVAKCQNDQGTYNLGMNNYLVSPTITLPMASSIRVDFDIRGSIYYNQATPANSDVFGWEISPDNGSTWYAMSNPYNTPGIPNYVYLTPLEIWSSMVGSYSLDGYISEYAGHDVKFRIFLRSRGFHEPEGEGIMIDNYAIYYEQYVAPPYGLTAEQIEHSVHLDWESPVGYSEEFLTSTNSAWVSYINDGQPYAQKITNPHDTEMPLGSVGFVLYEPDTDIVNTTASIFVWEDNGGLPGAQILNVDDIDNIPSMSWRHVDITEHNIMIPPNGSIFVGVGNFGTVNQGLLADNTSPVCNTFAFIQNSWMPLEEAYIPDSGALMNAGIGGSLFIEDEDTPEPDSYVIYRSTTAGTNFAEIGTSLTTDFIDNDPVFGVMNYYVVTAVYDELGESGYSNQAALFVLPDEFIELHYDDGNADDGYSVGIQNHYAVFFEQEYLVNSNFLFIKMFIYQRNTGQLIFKIWDHQNDVPGNLLAQFMIPANQISQGWNYFAISPDNPIYLPAGGFYVGVMELGGASLVGIDHNNVGSSIKKIGDGPWQDITEGNLMIRAIIDQTTDTVDELIPVTQKLTARNFPNPFNPQTNISLNMPYTTDVVLSIYNLKGQLVNTVFSGELEAGSHSFLWNGTDNHGNNTASGIYFYRIETSDKVITNKMLLLK